MALILCTGVLGGCGQVPDGVGHAPVSSEVSTVVSQPPGLAPRARELIDAAKRAGRETVVLTISTVQGETESTARALRELGAVVESTDATVGYIRADVPIAVAAQAATLDGVSRADVEEQIGFPDPTP